MTKIVKTKCQNCDSDILTEYVKLGLQVQCQHCLQFTVPIIRNGTVMPVTNWEITYRNFRQLISEKAYRKEIGTFFKKKFGYSIEDQDLETLILNGKNEAIDPLWLHLKIQESGDLQYQLYQLAMSLWR